MFELLALLGFLLVVAFILCVFVLPIVAFVRTQRLGEIVQRLTRLERELASLRQARTLATPAPAEELPTVEPAAVEEVTKTAPAPSPVTKAPPVSPRRPPRPVVSGAGFAGWESWIGGRGLGWTAAVLLLVASALFLKYAFDNEWIGPRGQITLIVLLGAGLCGGGFHLHREGRRLFSQMLTGAGAVVLYLAAFASFYWYHPPVLSQEWGGGFLILLVIETTLLALLYDSWPIALMAVAGGLVTPLWLASEHDQYVALFLYLLAVDAGAVILTLLRPWSALNTLALCGTQALFWGWYAQNYHPEKLPAALAFQAALFVLFLFRGLVAHVFQKRPASLETLVRIVLGAFFFALAATVLLWEDHRIWMGTLAVVLAGIYTGLAWFVFTWRSEDRRLLLTLVGVALGFVAAVFPLQFDGVWIPLGWAVEGVVLWWFGLRAREQALRWFGAALLVVAAGRLIFVDTPALYFDLRGPFVLLANSYALPALGVAACILAAAEISRRFFQKPEQFDRVAQAILGLGGVLLAWFIISQDVYQFFVSLGDWWDRDRPVWQYGYDPERRWLAQAMLSAFWAAYAGLVLAVGLRVRSEPLRWTALGLFALTLLKVVFFDTAELPGLLRVLVFFALAVIMLAGAWGYQKFLLPARPAREVVAQ
jgi:uncharacterized membrane protein